MSVHDRAPFRSSHIAVDIHRRACHDSASGSDEYAAGLKYRNLASAGSGGVDEVVGH